MYEIHMLSNKQMISQQKSATWATKRVSRETYWSTYNLLQELLFLFQYIEHNI